MSAGKPSGLISRLEEFLAGQAIEFFLALAAGSVTGLQTTLRAAGYDWPQPAIWLAGLGGLSFGVVVVLGFFKFGRWVGKKSHPTRVWLEPQGGPSAATLTLHHEDGEDEFSCSVQVLSERGMPRSEPFDLPFQHAVGRDRFHPVAVGQFDVIKVASADRSPSQLRITIGGKLTVVVEEARRNGTVVFPVSESYRLRVVVRGRSGFRCAEDFWLYWGEVGLFLEKRVEGREPPGLKSHG